MNFIKETTLKFYKYILLKKVLLLKSLALIFVLILSSILIEYFIFGNNLNVGKKSNKAIHSLEKENVTKDNFILNDQGIFVSQIDNATLTIKNNSEFINNLELTLVKNPNLRIEIEYINPRNNQKIGLESNAQNNLKKNKLEILNFIVFHIEDHPQEIKIIAKSAGSEISQISVDNSYYFNFYRFIFILAVEILFVFFVLFRKKIGKNPEYAFFIIAFVCGTLISIGETRSFISWDDHIHYKRVDNMTLKNIFKKKITDIYARTNSVPHSFSIKEQKTLDNYFDNDTKKQTSKNKEYNFSLIKFYNNLGYLPSSLAIIIGKILHLPYHIIFVLGRWVNILVFSAVVFLAIRKIESGKIILATVALLPTSIFLASNYSYDSWVTAFSMLGLVYLFSALQKPDQKITTREIIIMLGTLIIGCGPKAIYFPLLLLLFLLKPIKFDSIRQYKKFIIATIISILFVLGSFILPFIINGPGDGDGRGGKDVNSTEQVRFILSEPVAYAKILLSFIGEYLGFRNTQGFIASFAYLGNIYGHLILFITIIIVAFTDKNNLDKETSNLKTKFLTILIYFGTVALISTALYITFTPVRSQIINGVQPRYLFPLLFPLLFVIGNYRIKIPLNKNIYSLIIFVIMSFVLMQGIWNLIIKLYY